MKNEDRNVLKGLAAGAAGGLIAAFVMGKFQALISAASKQKQGAKNKSKADEPANVKVAESVSENVFDHKLTKSEKEPAGTAVHYWMGAASGAIYGVSNELAPVSSLAAGIPFGAAVWLIADDIVVPALGFSKPASEFPLSTHLYALSSHLVYGLTTEIVRGFVRKNL